MFAFVDETGNTGSNLFDETQPDFYSGALVTKTNFDLVCGPAVRSICKSAGIDALHASVLGLDRLEEIAVPFLKVLKKADARFFIARVEKRYLLATKIFDTFFDSGENPAVPWTTYNVRLLRVVLCFKVATLITEGIARQFWAMLMAKSEKAARSMIPGICDAILELVPELPDQRSRDVVTEALSWSRAHPEALDIFIPGRQAKNGHMPNIMAFANLLDGLEKLSKSWGRPLRKIVHDRQSQFEDTLAEWHRMFSTASDEPIDRPGETFVFQKVAGSTFEISASDESPGIQVADVVLWLFRQAKSGKPLPEDLHSLLMFALKRGWHSDFSFSGVGPRLEEQWQAMMAADIPADAQARAQKILADTERNRQEAMELYEVDGLMPYERQRERSLKGE